MTRKTSKASKTERTGGAQDPEATAPSDPATESDDGNGRNDDADPQADNPTAEGNESARAGKVRDPENDG